MFRRYLRCDSEDHLFHTCPNKANMDMKQKQIQDLWDHALAIRKPPTNIPDPKVTIATPADPSIPHINVLSITTNPQGNHQKKYLILCYILLY